MPVLHQFLAGFAKSDAISNEALAMRNIFRSWGYESEIFSEAKRIPPELRREARDASHYAAAAEPSDITLLHLSIGSVVNDIFAALPCRKVILYHNVTPPAYFQIVQPRVAFDLARGLKQMKALSGAAAVNMADSRFNADQLAEAGCRDVRVLPPLLSFDRLDTPPDRRVIRQWGDGTVNVLFVGRCAPNKKIEDLLTAISYFQRTVEPNSRLIFVGSHAGTERYYHAVLSLARDLELRNTVFAGCVTEPELNAYYRIASLFLCMSEHEGFCVPLIESMWHGVLVLAYAAAAVPETLDGAGCLFREKKYPMIAEMMGRLVHDPSLRQAVLEGQRRRLERYRARDFAAELRGHLAPVMDGKGTGR